MLLGGPGGRRAAEPDARRAGRSRVPHAARHGERAARRCSAGFTTVRNLGLFVKTGGYLLDVALHARDRQRLDRRAAHRARRPRDHPERRPPRPDDVPAARARHHAADASRRASPTACPRCARRPLPDQVRRQAHQDLRVGRRDVAQHRARRAAVLRRGARRDRRRGAPRRAPGRGARARRRRHPGLHPGRRRLHRARLAGQRRHHPDDGRARHVPRADQLPVRGAGRSTASRPSCRQEGRGVSRRRRRCCRKAIAAGREDRLRHRRARDPARRRTPRSCGRWSTAA